MLQKDDGIVLKATRQGESSKLVTFLGRQSGKTRLIAKGALTEKSPFRGVLEAGNYLEVVYYYKGGRSVYFLREANIHAATQSGSKSLADLSATLAVLELLDRVCYWGSADERIPYLYLEYQMARPLDPLFLFLVFEFKLLELLGSLPDILSCRSCDARVVNGYYHPQEGASVCEKHAEPAAKRVMVDGAMVDLVETLNASSLAAFRDVEPDASLRKRLGRILHWTYTFHIHGYSLPSALKLIPKGDSPDYQTD